MKGCSNCCEVSKTIEIRTPEELCSTIRTIRENMRTNTLVEIENSINQKVLGIKPFDHIEENGPWGDFFSHYFQCTHCRTNFLLHVETYNGSGGTWEPFND